MFHDAVSYVDGGVVVQLVLYTVLRINCDLAFVVMVPGVAVLFSFSLPNATMRTQSDGGLDGTSDEDSELSSTGSINSVPPTTQETLNDFYEEWKREVYLSKQRFASVD